MCDNVILYNNSQRDLIRLGAIKIKCSWMHFLKIHFLRCINAVGWVKKRHAPRCIHKMQAILSVSISISYVCRHLSGPRHPAPAQQDRTTPRSGRSGSITLQQRSQQTVATGRHEPKPYASIKNKI